MTICVKRSRLTLKPKRRIWRLELSVGLSFWFQMFFLQSILENTKEFGRPNVPPCRQHQILTRLGPRYTHNVRASFLQPPNKMGLSSMCLLRSPVRSLRRAMLRAVSWKKPASLWKTRRPKRLEHSRILIWKSGCLHQRMILYNQQLLLKMCCKNNLDSIWLFDLVVAYVFYKQAHLWKSLRGC